MRCSILIGFSTFARSFKRKTTSPSSAMATTWCLATLPTKSFHTRAMDKYGIMVFHNLNEKTAFLESANSGVLSELLPHLEELGFPPASDEMKRRSAPRIRKASYDPLVVRLWDVGKSRWKELRQILDNPSFHLDIDVSDDWPLLLEVARHATPRLFDALVLRGADPYEFDTEGDTAMETANPKLTTHLVRAFDMSPNHQSYAGISPMMTAIWHNDLGRGKALVKAGVRINQRVWEEASPLPMAIRDGHDEISRFLIHHGAVNRDLSGRVRPVEPWMVGQAPVSQRHHSERRHAKSNRLLAGTMASK